MTRLDQLLVSKGLATSRSLAQKYIADGAIEVFDNKEWCKVKKASAKYSEDVEVRVIDHELSQFVSRGALKLKGAIETFPVNLDGICALDIGQSTGGFTDYMLQNGVAEVVGVDVGRDQLAARIRQDSRVTCIEGFNARSFPKEFEDQMRSKFDLIVMDVSFISQTLILPNLLPILKPQGKVISLVKPQFELEPALIGKGGIVRDISLYSKVESKIKVCVFETGMNVSAYFESPVTGFDGNREFFVVMERS